MNIKVNREVFVKGDNMQLTIFTPTYNREKYLTRLYKSLVNQSNNNFEWVIVDDGSTDSTTELVEKFIKEKILSIRYFKQENLGKHVAHNKGVELCKTELFFCVDSDDYLTSNCVEVCLKAWNEEENLNSITGIVALRGYSNGEVMGNFMPQKIKKSTLSDLYNIYEKKGETALILKTEHLKNNLFPIFKEEKFLSEEILYNKLDSIAPLKVINKIIYIMEYLDGGLTKNYIKMWKQSPQGVITLLKSRYEKIASIKCWKKYFKIIKVILILNAFCINQRKSILKNSPNKMLSVILLLPSFSVEYIKFR